MKFSEYFRINKSQYFLDFLDVHLGIDNPFYLDPYATQRRNDEWSDACSDLLNSFFTEVLEGIRRGDDAKVAQLLVHLGEPNETYLGVSAGSPRGRGIGELKANDLVYAIKHSSAFKTGILSDISETQLFIDGIGPDMISDLTTNILRGALAEYTKQQCELYSVPLARTADIGPIWNLNTLEWQAQTLELPDYGGRPVLLIPKFAARRELSLTKDEFYKDYVREILKQEHINSGSSLVKVFKTGRRKGQSHVLYKDIERICPPTKENISDFAVKNPDSLKKYTTAKSHAPPPSNFDLGAEYLADKMAANRARDLIAIPTGRKDADKYHDVILDLLSYIFYPNLIRPRKEAPIHAGRKRIDIVYTNSGVSGFFKRMQSAPQSRALTVVIECKNYSGDPKNPELDQITGRFSPTRGYLGFLLCRQIKDRELFVERCQNAFKDQHGIVIPMTDEDVLELVDWRIVDDIASIEDHLEKLFEQIIS